MSEPINALQAKAAQSTQDVQNGATPDTAASKAALQQTVQQTPPEGITPRAARVSELKRQDAKNPRYCGLSTVEFVRWRGSEGMFLQPGNSIFN
jgi:hypothetical protein